MNLNLNLNLMFGIVIITLISGALQESKLDANNGNSNLQSEVSFQIYCGGNLRRIESNFLVPIMIDSIVAYNCTVSSRFPYYFTCIY